MYLYFPLYFDKSSFFAGFPGRTNKIFKEALRKSALFFMLVSTAEVSTSYYCFMMKQSTFQKLDIYTL